ncbi:CHAT domain-containing protein [Lyngbya sp. CCY1209]|uniref:CHAT domain-containing protein n=1 Tax=Lyngbya sp. CCY1209 TaxID=2886103 RepID=UPI002D1FDFF0|nr:CHAT domain-containing protein [Lyngbya sp. CCY1209]MEB3883519.1 CHAT domain-containing protein [Lyngbya sp. CCY1209]
MAIALLAFCLSLGLHFMSPVLATSSPANLVQQGNQLLRQGKAEAALEVWQKAEEIYRKNNDIIGAIGSQVNQAQALTDLGFYRRSCDTVLEAFGNNLQCDRLTDTLLNEVLETFDTANNNLNFQGLQSLGNGLRAIGKLDLSQRVLEASLELAEDANTEGQALLNLGNTTRSQSGRAANFKPKKKSEREALQNLILKGLSDYQQAATISPDRLIQIQSTINHLSFLIQFNQWLREGDRDNLLEPHVQFQGEKLPEIIGSINRIEPEPQSIKAAIKLAELLTDLERQETNPIVEKLTANLAELIRSGFVEGELLEPAIKRAETINNYRLEAYGMGVRATLYQTRGELETALNLSDAALAIAQKVSASDIAYQLQEQVGDIYNQKGNSKAALEAYTSAFNTLQVLRRNLVALNRDLQFDFRDRIEPLYRKLVALLLQPEPGSTQPSLSHLKAAREVIESLQLAELDNFFQDACVSAENINIDEIDEHSAVIYPVIAPDQLGVIVKLPGADNFRYSSVSDRDFETQFNERLSQLKRTMMTARLPVGETKSLSGQIYRWLIEPFEADLEADLERDESQIKTLVFVLDGLLRNIPMSVLYDGDRDRYLVERYAIAVVPGLQLIDPNPLLKEQVQALTAGIAQEAPSFAVEGFAALQYVEPELKAIRETVPESEKLADDQFTKMNVQIQINSEPFTIVHIATHGQFSSNPDDTFILDWNERINVRDLDRLLQTQEVQESDRPIELLILSACQTATGDTRAALGLAGVSIRAGARSVLASLWSVNDASTAEFMKQFYRQLLQSGSSQLRKAEALREVQIGFIRRQIKPNSDYYKPYYWSPFILVGNWL